MPQRQFAHVGGRPVGQHIATRHHFAHLHQWSLINAGVLVGAGVFGQVVDVYARLARLGFGVIHSHHDASGVHRIHYSTALGDHTHPGIARHDPFHAGADQRLIGAQGGHGLPLHIGTHQRPVGVVVFQERNQCRRDRNDLLGRHIHVLHLVRPRQGEFILMTAGHQLVGQFPRGIERGVGLGDDVLAFLDGGQVINPINNLPIFDSPIRRLQETIRIGSGVNRQRVDQTDVRAFRGFNRTDPAIVGGVNVAHLETGSFAGQTARPQR